MKKEDVIKHQFNGLTSEISDWECLTPTVFLKQDVKEEASEKEIIFAYLRAAEILHSGLKNDNNPSYHLKIIHSNQVCMPFLYICRHALELSIKYRLRLETQESITGHKLQELYNKLTNAVPKLKRNNDLSLLVEVLNEIDDDGCKLRYTKDKNNHIYHEKPTFIQTTKILALEKNVCNYLIELVHNK